MGAFIDLTGRQIGRLTVIKRWGYSGKNILWLCLCSCEKVKVIAGRDLSTGHTISCGCWGREKRAEASSIANRTHGKSRTPIYVCWAEMMARCYRRSHTAWDRYGGRGIKVCQRWHKFENFYMDMGDPPPGLSLDRKDNDKGYSKANCRWATRLEQQNNRRPPSEWKRRGRG